MRNDKIALRLKFYSNRTPDIEIYMKDCISLESSRFSGYA